MNIIHCCPACGESYYYEKYTTTTCLYCVPLYKNGVLITKDPNKTTHYCTCAACGKEFVFETGGEDEFD